MDGILINSEPLWEEAEILIFAKYGKNVTPQMCQSMQGNRISVAINKWCTENNWTDLDYAQIEREILAKVEDLVVEKGPKMPGVDYILEFLTGKNIKIGLASSSNLSLIEKSLEKLQIRKYFQAVCSAQFEIAGKPAPYIYLTAARTLNVLPQNCLAFEDAFPGIVSAKEAGMKVVAIPDEKFYDDEKFALADYKLKSFLEFDEKMWNYFS